mmetsp:Transcript_105293/g.181603  ORF Transcript_105293/g.181603 Transcript_105293/m.181603 type:complete len:229 (+) Transcript_105293:183-869(+)
MRSSPRPSSPRTAAPPASDPPPPASRRHRTTGDCAHRRFPRRPVRTGIPAPIHQSPLRHITGEGPGFPNRSPRSPRARPSPATRPAAQRQGRRHLQERAAGGTIRGATLSSLPGARRNGGRGARPIRPVTTFSRIPTRSHLSAALHILRGRSHGATTTDSNSRGNSSGPRRRPKRRSGSGWSPRTSSSGMWRLCGGSTRCSSSGSCSRPPPPLRTVPSPGLRQHKSRT